MRDFGNRSDTERELDEYYNNNNQGDNRFYNNYFSNNSVYDRNNDYPVNNNNNTYNNYNNNYNMNNNFYDNSQYDYDNRNNYNVNNINNLHNYQTENQNRVYINEPKKIAPVLFLVAFISTFGLLFITTFIDNVELRTFITNLFPILFLGVFSLISISTAFTPIITGTIKRRRCKFQLKATIVDVHIKRTSKGGRTYIPTYQYFYMGKEYIVTTRAYNGFLRPEIGYQVDVLINEDNPEDYYIGNKKSEIISLVMGILFALLPIIFCLKTAIADFFYVY